MNMLQLVEYMSFALFSPLLLLQKKSNAMNKSEKNIWKAFKSTLLHRLISLHCSQTPVHRCSSIHVLGKPQNHIEFCCLSNTK